MFLIYIYWKPTLLPTPVSALIHAATMVTAGVYLLMRCSPLIEYSSTVLILCLWLGAITTVFSSLVGLFQQDIKKVIAYSTMSQLAQEYINYDIFRHQTICVEIISIINSQVTKALNYSVNQYNYINSNFLNSFSGLYDKNRQYLCRFNTIIMSEKWKVIIVSKLVGTSEAIRLILIYFSFIFIYLITICIICFKRFATTYAIYSANKLNTLNFELCTQSIRVKAVSDLKQSLSENQDDKIKSQDFYEWLAGVIDGDGYFNLSKKGTARCNIVMDIRDKNVLYQIKHKFGGSIYSISGAKALRYQLSHKKGLITLINSINGLIRNPTRMLQMNKLCVKYEIKLLYPKPLTFNNGWLSGFIDSDGSVYFNEESGQVFISVSQKNKYLLEPLIKLYGGRVDILSPKIEAFKYIVYRKKELFNLLDNYFTRYGLKSMKNNRINLIKQFYLLRIYKDSKDINKLNEWLSFKDKWEKYIN